MRSAREPVATCLAVDVGGTKLAVGLVDRRGDLLLREQAPTAGDDPETLFDALTSLMDLVREKADVAAPGAPIELCGVGCGGPMAPGGAHVSPLNIPAWREFPLRDRIARHLGLPTFVDNDAKALALAEGWVGAARGTSNYLAMVVSTGIGGGIVLDGRLLDGEAGNAGHIGHVVVEPLGRVCACGGRGCLEAEASGLALAAITGHPPEKAPPEMVRRCGELVGRAVGSVANLLDLQLAVVAGSVALGFGEPFFTAARRELEGRARLSYSRGAAIGPAGLGGGGPLVGAAAVGWAGSGERLLGTSR